MREMKRRRVLQATGGTVVAMLAGCSGGGGGGSGGDAEMDLKLNLSSFGADTKLKSVTLSVDQATFVSKDGDVTLPVGSEVTVKPSSSSKGTVLSGKPFPSGTYEELKISLSVSSATRKDGSSASVTVDSPLSVGLVIVDDPMTVESGQSMTVTMRLSADSTGSGWTISSSGVSYSAFGRLPPA